MQIAIFSMGPIFKDTVHGGSQKTLREIALHLGEAGHRCQIYCTQRSDNYTPFQLAERVHVFPVLRFKETYPEPYYSAPYKLQQVICTVRNAIADCDVFYIHDAELLYHFLYEEVPTVVAVQDFVYPDTLAGCMSFRRDRLIVTSDYVRSAVLSVFGQFCEIRPSDVTVIPNSFDLDVFRRTNSERLRRAIGLSENCVAVLYPHRPDPKKGLFEAVEVVDRLRRLIPASHFARLKLLVPKWMDSNIKQDEGHVYQRLYSDVRQFARDVGLADKVVIHDWLPLSQMPEYYSLGAATLCIGNFIEAFGNVSVESELCGTPTVVSRVGAQRSILPEHLTTKVDYRDLDTAAELLAEILLRPSDRTAEVRGYVRARYLSSSSMNDYLEAITSCQLRPRIPECKPWPLKQSDLINVPAWCSLVKRGYYNDYEYGYVNDTRLLSVVSILQSGPKEAMALVERGFDIGEMSHWIRDGQLVQERRDL